jgi:hypothetical protein
MTNISFYLDFLIALVFILAICSNILAVCYETYSYFFKQRARFLKKVIAEVLNDVNLKDCNLAESLYNHPQIDLTKKDYRFLPSYISSVNFAQTLIEIIFRKLENKSTVISSNPKDGQVRLIKPEFPQDQLERFRLGVQDLPYSDLKILLEGFLNNSENTTEKLQSNIENWYNEYMNRASGWYKMIVQKRMIIFSFLIAVAFNMDFFRICTTLLTDKEITKVIAQKAENYQPVNIDYKNSSDTMAALINARKELLAQLYEMNAPIGWSKEKDKGISFWKWASSLNFGDWVLKITGWLLTAIALSFGAPFWFDLLSKLINIRKTGLKPKT